MGLCTPSVIRMQEGALVLSQWALCCGPWRAKEPPQHLATHRLPVTVTQRCSLDLPTNIVAPCRNSVWFWPRFGHLRQILIILKDSCNPRLKSVVFDRWFDMFSDSRLVAVASQFYLWQNSVSVRRFGAQSCSVTTPMTNVKLSSFFKIRHDLN